MVAPASSTPPAPTKAPARKVLLNVMHKAQIRNFYLVLGLTHEEIAARTGLTRQIVSNYISRAKMPAIKRGNEAKINQRADARVNAQLDEISEAIASQSEEIALGGLTRAREEIESRDEFASKNFQSWTGGVRNLAQVAKLVRGQSDGPAAGNVSLSVFLVRADRAERSEKPVAPAVEVLATSVQ